jgi:hypothetical protein
MTLLAALAISCGGQGVDTLSQLVADAGDAASGHVEDHTFVTEPHTGVCGVKFEGSSFEGEAPAGWDAIWVKAALSVCCIEGACEPSDDPACACYAAGVDADTGAVAVGFAEGYMEGPFGNPDGVFCAEISFVMFETACQPPPEEPGDDEPPSEDPL